MGAQAIEDRHYTYEEYIELLQASEFKIECLDGKIRMMSAASQAHVDIRDTLQGELYKRKAGCQVKGSDQAVFIRSSNKYYFPDLTVVCGKEPTYTPSKISQLTNPTLIVEVLSDSTEVIDRSEKFHAYFSIPEFMEYVLVDSRTRRIDTFYRQAANTWSMRSYYRPDDQVEFQSMNLTLPLHLIYQEVSL
jgi:Uma2 family endonuclease